MAKIKSWVKSLFNGRYLSKVHFGLTISRGLFLKTPSVFNKFRRMVQYFDQYQVCLFSQPVDWIFRLVIFCSIWWPWWWWRKVTIIDKIAFTSLYHLYPNISNTMRSGHKIFGLYFSEIKIMHSCKLRVIVKKTSAIDWKKIGPLTSSSWGHFLTVAYPVW